MRLDCQHHGSVGLVLRVNGFYTHTCTFLPVALFAWSSGGWILPWGSSISDALVSKSTPRTHAFDVSVGDSAVRPIWRTSLRMDPRSPGRALPLSRMAMAIFPRSTPGRDMRYRGTVLFG